MTDGTTSLLLRLRDHLRRRRLFSAPGTAIVGVSGGADSVALLDLLHGLASELGLSLVVAHADHGIASDSRAVGQAVGNLAKQYGLPFELGELHLGPDATETGARKARYAWLGDAQRRHSARYLVTAHHRNDQVETIVLRLLRGSAPAGLAGIPARGRGGLVRPLLAFTKAELAAHVASRGLSTHDVVTYGIVSLVLVYSAYVAEVYRAGIESVHESQTAAARSLGLSRWKALRFVVLPQAIRRVIPPLLNDFIGLQKDTALVSVIGPIEAAREAQNYGAQTFNFAGYVVAAEETGFGMDDRGERPPMGLGPALAETGDREHDDAGITAREFLPAETEVVEDPGPEVLQDHVGRDGQSPGDLPPLGHGEVDADVALPGVELGVEAGEASPDLAEVPGHVTLGRLELHDIGAEVGQKPTGEGTGQSP